VSHEPDEYHSAIFDLEETYRQGVRAFAKWFSETWTMTREEWIKAFDDPPPSDDYFKGFNAGVESVSGALDQFLDEFHH